MGRLLTICSEAASVTAHSLINVVHTFHSQVGRLLAARQAARLRHDYKDADRLRDALNEQVCICVFIYLYLSIYLSIFFIYTHVYV